MSGRAFAAVIDAFTGEAIDAFQFLSSEFDMNGPEIQREVIPVVSYMRQSLQYEVSLDPSDMTAATRVHVELPHVRLTAELADLVQAAGLGARNHVPHTVHTMKSLRKTLDTQAKYVRLLHPNLGPADNVELMRLADATERRLRESR